jgi:hypothetical protein
MRRRNRGRSERKSQLTISCLLKSYSEEEKNELAKLSLRRQLLLGQVLLGEM